MSEEIFETCDKATQHSFSVPWKIKECHVGEDCWCRIIMPEKTIKYKRINSVTKEEVITEIDCIIPDGSVDKLTAEYIVELHNMQFERNEKIKN
jgi:hypothetical protein